MSRFTTLQSRLDSLAGLDLEPDDRDSLLVEGHRELCTRSEWTQATLEFGPTVAGQPSYAVPATVDKILKVSVAGVPFHLTDEDSTEWVTEGTIRSDVESGSGLYFLTFDASGNELLVLYTTPTAASPISARCVVVPPDISTTQEPLTPARGDKFIWAYAAAQAYEADEDNPELAQFYSDQFETGILLLRQLRLSKAGRGPFMARVVGVTS